MARVRGDRRVEIVGHFIGPNNVPYLDVKVNGKLKPRRLTDFARRFPTFVIEYAYRNRLSHLAQHLYDRHFNTVTKSSRAISLTDEYSDIHPPVFFDRMLLALAMTMPKRLPCAEVPDSQPPTFSTPAEPSEGLQIEKLHDLQENYAKNLLDFI